jgi:hypothetical protein
VCGGQINEEGMKAVVYVGYRHTAGYKKASYSRQEATPSHTHTHTLTYSSARVQSLGSISQDFISEMAF